MSGNVSAATTDAKATMIIRFMELVHTWIIRRLDLTVLLQNIMEQLVPKEAISELKHLMTKMNFNSLLHSVMASKAMLGRDLVMQG